MSEFILTIAATLVVIAFLTGLFNAISHDTAIKTKKIAEDENAKRETDALIAQQESRP